MTAQEAYNLAMANIELNPTIIEIREAAEKGHFSVWVARVPDQDKLKKLGYKFKWYWGHGYGPNKCCVSWDHFK